LLLLQRICSKREHDGFRAIFPQLAAQKLCGKARPSLHRPSAIVHRQSAIGPDVANKQATFKGPLSNFSPARSASALPVP
jgi:hypothetical protein